MVGFFVKVLDKMEAQAAEELRIWDHGLGVAMEDGSRHLQLGYREEINTRFRSSERVRGGNRRVANAIRREVYHDGPLDHAALVYSKFGRRRGGEFLDYLGPSIAGATIRPRRADRLFVPLVKSFLQVEGARRFRSRARGARFSFRDTPRLAFINIGGGKTLIVQRTKSGRGRGRPLALLTPEVEIQPKLDIDARLRREQALFPGRVVDAMNAESSRSSGGSSRGGGRRGRLFG